MKPAVKPSLSRSGLVGGGAAAFGLSGSSLADLFHPGVIKGQLTQLQAIGPKTPNPDKHIYGDNNHDFGPAVVPRRLAGVVAPLTDEKEIEKLLYDAVWQILWDFSQGKK